MFERQLDDGRRERATDDARRRDDRTRAQVIHRPSNALKELVENSLDAGAKSIAVTTREGGNKLLRVQDDGHGVRIEDLPLLCERHATSKIEKFEDLARCESFGFRGEALASMSYVAHVSATTMAAGATHATRATYTDGKMDAEGAKPIAGVLGTTISVENLFYNVVTRRKALKSASEEYSKVLEVLQRYAALRTDVAFTCRKHGESRATLHTPVAQSRVERLQAIYGPTVARDLKKLDFDSELSKKKFDFKLQVDGLVSGGNYHSKKTTFILFINSRLVECVPLKRACESVYAAILPKAEKPFVFMHLRLPFEDVDVNVHPTKQEVHFLHQEAIVELIQSKVEKILLATNSSRTFTVQTLLPGAEKLAKKDDENDAERSGDKENSEKADEPPASQAKTMRTQRERAGGDHKLVRTDANLAAGSLDAYLQRAMNSEGREHEKIEEVRRAVRERRGQRTEPEDTYVCELTSIRQLNTEIANRAHKELGDVIKNHTLVGAVDARKGVWLLQHQTKLFMVDAVKLTEEMFYQMALKNFANFGYQSLQDPASLAELALCALEDKFVDDEEWDASDGSKEEVAEKIAEMLVEKADMLKEYLGVVIDKERRQITGVPSMLPGYAPEIGKLPEFVLALAEDVDWTSEKECFETCARVIGAFFAMDCSFDDPKAEEGDAESDARRVARLCVFPAMKRRLAPPRRFADDGTVIQIACLEQLYKIFERC